MQDDGDASRRSGRRAGAGRREGPRQPVRKPANGAVHGGRSAGPAGPAPARRTEAKPQRRSNQDRTQATRAALLAAGRRLFIAKGFADTSTPEIVQAAAVTRGALYHHFKEKRDLFRAVVEAEAQAVAAAIEAAATAGLAPRTALMAGSAAYLDAMAEPGRARLLLIEGPAVLGAETMRALDDANAARTLREGLDAIAVAPGDRLSSQIAADLLSAAFDRAALLIEAGAAAAPVKATLLALLTRIYPNT